MRNLLKKILITVGVVMALSAVPAYAAGTEGPFGGTASSLNSGTLKTSQLEQFEYYLYSPSNAAENMPLVVYLHGHGAAQKIEEIKTEKFFVNLRNGGANGTPAYILAPLLPPELDFGYKGMWPGIESSVMELIEYVAKTYKIDRTRISIMGGSMGADAAIQIAVNHPEVFSCIVGVVPYHYQCPIAKWEEGWGNQLTSVPVWLLLEDEASAKQKAETAVNEINAAGGQAWLDILSGTDHGEATRQVASGMRSGQYEIFDWMISVRKPTAD